MQLLRAIVAFLLAIPLLAPAAAQATALTDSTSSCSGAPSVSVAASRFDLLQPCVAARGVVAMTMKEDEGDFWITMRPDPDSLALLPAAEATGPNPLLWVKVAADGTPDLGQPKAGDHLAVSGALVWDKTWGWREVRPVWKIDWLPATPLPAPSVGVSVSGLQVGSSTIYSIVVNNPTNQDFANLILTAPLDAGTTLHSVVATPDGATLGGTSGAITWDLSDLAGGTTAGPFVYKIDGAAGSSGAPTATLLSGGDVLAASSAANTVRAQ